MRRLLFTILGCLALAPALYAQDTVDVDVDAPVVTLATPEIGTTLTSRKATVAGTVTDVVGVKEVRYRVEGSRKWRKAVLTVAGGTDTTFVILAKFKKRSHGRIYVRAVDDAGNESDTIGRRYIISN
ncbi:MAG: hypothetical protein ACI9R3_000332 [Verrucomicrobiales bacterium]|jgi:uncharacterized protein (DUF697 family)